MTVLDKTTTHHARPTSSTTISVTEADSGFSQNAKMIGNEIRQPLSPNVTFSLPDKKLTKGGEPVGLEAVREYIATMWLLYQGLPSKSEKSEVLDSICLTLKIHRKAATRLMRKKQIPQLRRRSGCRVERYSPEARRWFVHLWLKMGRICARRMKAALPEWLPLYREAEIPKSLKVEIFAMGTSTMDRILKPVRAQIKRHRNSGTRRSANIAIVPLRPLGQKITELGHVEVDTVAHHGDCMSGTFAWTVTMTDLYSGWTCARAVIGKSAKAVVDALREMEQDFPFQLRAFYSDCGTEFINETMIDTFKKRLEKAIELYRSRPYKKNDNAHVEQKNNVFVRELFGYSRVESPLVVERMNAIYKNIWQPLNNLYLPQSQTIEKLRVGAKIKRRMSAPITPFERVCESQQISEAAKGRLIEEKMAISPWTLKDKLKVAKNQLWRHFLVRTRWTEEIKNAI